MPYAWSQSCEENAPLETKWSKITKKRFIDCIEEDLHRAGISFQDTLSQLAEWWRVTLHQIAEDWVNRGSWWRAQWVKPALWWLLDLSWLYTHSVCVLWQAPRQWHQQSNCFHYAVSRCHIVAVRGRVDSSSWQLMAYCYNRFATLHNKIHWPLRGSLFLSGAFSSQWSYS